MMLSRTKAGIIILCIMVIFLLTAGCSNEQDQKTKTTYSLNRQTNQVEGTVENLPIQDGGSGGSLFVEVQVECTTIGGVKNAVWSERTEEILPGGKAKFKTSSMPQPPSGDSYTTCRVLGVTKFSA